MRSCGGLKNGHGQGLGPGLDRCDQTGGYNNPPLKQSEIPS